MYCVRVCDELNTFTIAATQDRPSAHHIFASLETTVGLHITNRPFILPEQAVPRTAALTRAEADHQKYHCSRV
jgi:hypothetical protein